MSKVCRPSSLAIPKSQSTQTIDLANSSIENEVLLSEMNKTQSEVEENITKDL